MKHHVTSVSMECFFDPVNQNVERSPFIFPNRNRKLAFRNLTPRFAVLEDAIKEKQAPGATKGLLLTKGLDSTLKFKVIALESLLQASVPSV